MGETKDEEVGVWCKVKSGCYSVDFFKGHGFGGGV